MNENKKKEKLFFFVFGGMNGLNEFDLGCSLHWEMKHFSNCGIVGYEFEASPPLIQSHSSTNWFHFNKDN